MSIYCYICFDEKKDNPKRKFILTINCLHIYCTNCLYGQLEKQRTNCLVCNCETKLFDLDSPKEKWPVRLQTPFMNATVFGSLVQEYIKFEDDRMKIDLDRDDRLTQEEQKLRKEANYWKEREASLAKNVTVLSDKIKKIKLASKNLDEYEQKMDKKKSASNSSLLSDLMQSSNSSYNRETRNYSNASYATSSANPSGSSDQFYRRKTMLGNSHREVSSSRDTSTSGNYQQSSSSAQQSTSARSYASTSTDLNSLNALSIASISGSSHNLILGKINREICHQKPARNQQQPTVQQTRPRPATTPTND